MVFSFGVFSVVLVLVSFVCLIPMICIGQVLDDEVVCAVGVKWFGGELRLDDLVSGRGSVILTVDDNLNSMTRNESSGIFYFASGNTFNIWKYDPCDHDSDNNVTKFGPISGMTFTSWGLAYCIDDNGLYMSSGTSLYSIDLDSLDATLIGDVGTSVQGLECDNNGDLYGSQYSRGLVKINKNDASVISINSNVPNLVYLAYDPNNNNILYGSDYDGNIIQVNKISGEYSVTNLIDDGISAASAYRGMIILDQDFCDYITGCPIGECEYGMYDHSDSINSQLLSEGWVPLTFNELRGDYFDSFISYYNLNGGLEALLSWSSDNCCFSFSESNDVQLIINVDSTLTEYCHVYPEIDGNMACNPSGGYIQGRIYSFFSENGCNNGNQHFNTIPYDVTIDTTHVCQPRNNPGIWRRCVIPNNDPTPSSTDTTTTHNPISTSDDDGFLCPNVINGIECIEDRNCLDCTPWGCFECADGYWIFEYNIACQACSDIDNCDTCSTWVGCEICDPDYSITWVKQCPLFEGGVAIIATCV